MSAIQVCKTCDRIFWQERAEGYRCTSANLLEPGSAEPAKDLHPSVPPCPLRTVPLRDE